MEVNISNATKKIIPVAFVSNLTLKASISKYRFSWNDPHTFAYSIGWEKVRSNFLVIVLLILINLPVDKVQVQ